VCMHCCEVGTCMCMRESKHAQKEFQYQVQQPTCDMVGGAKGLLAKDV
jgi:hypothetical protein